MKTKPRGITFLLAVIVSALALSLSLGISFILLEEFKLATYNKNSFRAFFAADSGADCALYWDFKLQGFMDPAGTYPPNIPTVLNCLGQVVQSPDLNVTENVFGSGFGTTTTFLLNSSNICVTVTVQKIGKRTVITSLGKSIACAVAAKPGTVQRGVEITY